MERLFLLNTLPWYTRLPIKWVIFGLAVLIVCYPHPTLFARHLRHWRDPNALIEPNAAALAPMVEELRSELTEDLSARETLNRVERYVHRRIPYEWDWNTWGMADYLPTVTEAIEMGREDCDGRAVVAASLLRNLGFEVSLVTDFAHVWVKTERGETMGPGRRKAIVATERGLQFRLGGLAELPRAIAYGVAVFPLLREVILVVVAWCLMLRRNGGVWCNVAGLVLLVFGLFALRIAGVPYIEPIVWMQWLGVVIMSAGLLLLIVWAGRKARDTGVDGVTGGQASVSSPDDGSV